MAKSSVIPIEAIQPDLSEFGEYLYKTMLTRGIKSFSALAQAMDSDSYRVHRPTVVKIAKGEQAAQPKFARRFAEVMEMGEEEERELMYALYRWG